MAEQIPGSNGNGSSGIDNRQFGIRRLYLKDVSFEAPNSPDSLSANLANHEIQLNLRTSQRDLGQGVFEVVLHVSAHAKSGDKSVFLVELEQAGTFQITGFPVEEVRAIIGVACPNTLFPYAREAIASLVQRGGFPPLLLQPIDFAALYQQADAAGGQA